MATDHEEFGYSRLQIVPTGRVAKHKKHKKLLKKYNSKCLFSVIKKTNKDG